MMRKYIIILLLVALTFGGCKSNQTALLENGDDRAVPNEYEKTITDYKKVVEFRLSDSFEEDWNNGKTVTLNETLQADLDTQNDKSDVSLKYKWDNMLIDMPNYVDTPTIETFGYILKDLNQDNSPELIWCNSERNVIFAVFTIHNGQAKLLDAYWSKYKVKILNTGEIYTLSEGGADSFYHNIMKLDSGGLKTVKSFGKEQNNYYESDDTGIVAIDESRFNKILSEYPFEFGVEWSNEQVTLLSSDQKEEVVIENEVNDNIDTELFPSESYQELCEYLYQLDVCMLQDEQSSYSNSDKVKTVEGYIERLNDAKEYYYDAISNTENDSAVLELENFDHTWKDNISDKLNTYQSLLEQQYDTGTIVPLLLTKHKYMLYRSWVVDVFELWLAFQSAGLGAIK